MAAKKIFISYSHNDVKWLESLKTHLKPLLREKSEIVLWDDTRIEPGTKWKDEIRKALEEASAAVLLVSPKFLDSDFIHNDELPTIYNAARNRGVRILWVPVKTSSYTVTPIADYQALHNPAKPLEELKGAARTKALVEIATAIVRELDTAAAEATPPAREDSFEDSVERTLGFAYHYKGPGRAFFYHVDMLWIWLEAFRRFQSAVGEKTKFTSTSSERFLSFLPSKPEPETGAEVLDTDAVDGFLDELVARGFCTRKERAMGQSFEVTDAGRAWFSRNRARIEAKMDAAGTDPG